MTARDPREKMMDNLETRVRWATDQCPVDATCIIAMNATDQATASGIVSNFGKISDLDEIRLFVALAKTLRGLNSKIAEQFGNDPQQQWTDLMETADHAQWRKSAANPDETPGE
jgi:Fe2+ transport system protein B